MTLTGAIVVVAKVICYAGLIYIGWFIIVGGVLFVSVVVRSYLEMRRMTLERKLEEIVESIDALKKTIVLDKGAYHSV